jgi:hypothetical protein
MPPHSQPLYARAKQVVKQESWESGQVSPPYPRSTMRRQILGAALALLVAVDHGHLAGLRSITDLARALEVGRRPAQARG